MPCIKSCRGLQQVGACSSKPFPNHQRSYFHKPLRGFVHLIISSAVRPDRPTLSLPTVLLNLTQLWPYAVIFVLSGFISAVVNGWLLRRHRRSALVPAATGPVQDRWVTASKPAIGGWSFFALFAIGLLVGFALFSDQLGIPFIALVLAALVGFWTGWIDDRAQLSPLLKFGGQFAAAHLLYFGGLIIELNGYPIVSYLATVLWVVGIMNSINMLDNMDGVAATASFFILLNCLIVGFSLGGINLYSLTFLIAMGALVGFLHHNRAPARLYMGDSGSQFLGVMLAGASILFLWQNRLQNTEEFFQLRQFILPLVAFIVPIIDTTTVTLRRLARGQSPFVGGRDHTTHQLARWGWSDAAVGRFFFAINLISVGLTAYLTTRLDSWSWPLTLAIIVYFGLLFFGFQLLYWLKPKSL